MSKAFGYFLSQPHQPFFALGIFNGVLFMILFLLVFKGVLAFDPGLLHSYSMLFLVFSNFFYGFTYTTFPRFSAQPPIDSRCYLRVWTLQLLATLSFLAAIWFLPAFYAATVFVAVGFAYTIRIFLEIYRLAPEPRQDQYWIIVAFGMGALSNLLFLLSQIPCTSCRSGVFFSYAVGTGVYLYLFSLPAVIGFRMVPFFSQVDGYLKTGGFHATLFALLLVHLLVEQTLPKGLFVVDLLLALYLGREILKIDLPFPNREPLLWSLHLALFWLPLGFLLASILDFFEAWFGYASLQLPLHLLALGFLTTILVAFGTRVTLGHGGAMLRVGRWGSFLFLFTQLVLLLRILLSLAASYGTLTPWLDIAATGWILLFALWSWKYGGILIRGVRREA